MANDRDQQDRNSDESGKKAGQGRDRVIGEGMNSLDSTQAPLKAETGEPDWEAMKGRVGSKDADEENKRSESDR
jgi:hypothetical protein